MRERLTFANVMSAIAVFLALGGSAVALKANSVGSRQIRDDAVRGREVADGKLKGKDLKAATITAREIEEGAFDLEPFYEMKSTQALCDPASSTFVSCGTVQLGVSEPSQALLVAGGGQTEAGEGSCKFRVDGSDDLIAAAPTLVGADGFGLTAVTEAGEPLEQGLHTFELVCNETDGEASFSTTLSVLTLGGDP